MGRIILDEQATPSTPAADKIAFYPKAGGGIYKKNDAGEEKRLVEAGADSLITSMTNLDDDGIPLAKVANAASNQANSSIVSINLAGGQIAFPATAVPSADLNTLDDYEEGEWTMGVSFGGGTTGIIYNYQLGHYTKIGNTVRCSGYLALSSKGTDTGDALITGLPFVIANNYGAYASVSIQIENITFADTADGYTDINTTSVKLKETTNAGVMAALTDADFADNSALKFALVYEI